MEYFVLKALTLWSRFLVIAICMEQCVIINDSKSLVFFFFFFLFLFFFPLSPKNNMLHHSQYSISHGLLISPTQPTTPFHYSRFTVAICHQSRRMTSIQPNKSLTKLKNIPLPGSKILFIFISKFFLFSHAFSRGIECSLFRN